MKSAAEQMWKNSLKNTRNLLRKVQVTLMTEKVSCVLAEYCGRANSKTVIEFFMWITKLAAFMRHVDQNRNCRINCELYSCSTIQRTAPFWWCTKLNPVNEWWRKMFFSLCQSWSLQTLFNMDVVFFVCLCSSVSGLLLVVLHSGEKLLAMDDDGYSDPYCIVAANKEKVLHISCTDNPSTEFEQLMFKLMFNAINRVPNFVWKARNVF